MSILQMNLAGARVLDLFAGSGALGLEALSRGAMSADFVEKNPRSVKVLKANIEKLGAGDVAKIHRADALQFAIRLSRQAYDLAFADPPYAEAAAVRLSTHWLDVPFASIFSVEHSASEKMPDGGDTRRYGSTAITIYRLEE